MNIDYANIIAKANERKDALMAFEKATNVLRDELAAAADTLEAMTDFVACCKKLDAEAHTLLPSEAVLALVSWVETILIHWRSAHQVASYRKISPDESLRLLTGGAVPKS